MGSSCGPAGLKVVELREQEGEIAMMAFGFGQPN